MKRLLLLLLLAPASAWAHSTQGLDPAPLCTTAQLAAGVCGVSEGDRALVMNGSTVTDCTVGGGAFHVECVRANGIWVAGGGGGGGADVSTLTDLGATCSPNNVIIRNPSAGNTFVCSAVAGGGDSILVGGANVDAVLGLNLIEGTTGIDFTFAGAPNPETLTFVVDPSEINLSGGELTGTLGVPVIGDGVAVSTWTLTNPTLINPALGTIASGNLSAGTGTAASLTVGAAAALTGTTTNCLGGNVAVGIEADGDAECIPLSISMNTSRLLGRTTASAGPAEEITVAPPLTLSALTLDITNILDADINNALTIAVGSSIDLQAATIPGIASGQIPIGQLAGNLLAYTTLNGDVTLTDTGLTTVQDNSVDGTDISIGTTNGDILYYNGTDWVRLAKGTPGLVLESTAGAPVWASDDGGSSTGANVGSGAGTIYRDNTGSVLNLKTLLAGSNVTLTNNANDITIAASGTGGGISTVGQVTGGTDQITQTVLRFDQADGFGVTTGGAGVSRVDIGVFGNTPASTIAGVVPGRGAAAATDVLRADGTWGAGGSGITAVGDCTGPACFDAAGHGTKILLGANPADDAAAAVALTEDNKICWETSGAGEICNWASNAVGLVLGFGAATTNIYSNLGVIGSINSSTADPSFVFDDTNVTGGNEGKVYFNCDLADSCTIGLSNESGADGIRISMVEVSTAAGASTLHLGGATTEGGTHTNGVTVAETGVMTRIGTGEINEASPRCIVFPADDVTCLSGAAGCFAETINGTGTSFVTANFLTTADSAGVWNFRTPAGWAGKTLSIAINWTSNVVNCDNNNVATDQTPTVLPDNVCWGAQMASVGDGASWMAPTFSVTEKLTIDTCFANGALMQAPIITAFASGLAANSEGILKVYRETNSTTAPCGASDTYSQDAKLIDVRVCTE